MQRASAIAVKRYHYDISDWRLRYPNPATIEAQPGPRTYVRRLFPAALVMILAAVLLHSAKEINDPAFQGPLQFTAGLLVLLGALHPVSALWQRLRIAREDDRFVVHARRFTPHTRACPLSALTGMNVLEREVRTSRKSGRRLVGWHWQTLLHTDGAVFEFCCDRRGDMSGTTRSPRRVAEFVRHLEGMTGLSCPPPQRVAWHSGLQGACPTGQRVVTTSAPRYAHRAYDSLDAMPPALRQNVEEHIARMRVQGITSFEVQQFTVADSDGNLHAYDSLDEMPPELRARFEAMRHQSR